MTRRDTTAVSSGVFPIEPERASWPDVRPWAFYDFSREAVADKEAHSLQLCQANLPLNVPGVLPEKLSVQVHVRSVKAPDIALEVADGLHLGSATL